MSHANNKATDKATADATSAFCTEFLGDLDTSTDAIVEAGVWEPTQHQFAGGDMRYSTAAAGYP